MNGICFADKVFKQSRTCTESICFLSASKNFGNLVEQLFQWKECFLVLVLKFDFMQKPAITHMKAMGLTEVI